MKNPTRTHLAVIAALLGVAACDREPSALSVPAKPLDVAPAPLPDDAAVRGARKALDEAIRERDPYARATRLATLVPALGPEAVPAVEATLRDARIDIGGTEVELLVRFWASHQPAEATRWAVEECPPAYRMPAVLTALPLWAEQDPRAALAAVEVWEQWRSDVREILQIGLVRGWYDRDPEDAARYVAEVGAGLGQQRALSTYVRILTQREGTEATMRWAEAIPDGDGVYKLAVYRQVGAALPLFDQQAALRWCEAHCDGRYGNNLRNVISRRWALEDGAGALAWLKTAPDSYEIQVAVRTVFAIWGQRRPDEARAWMAAQPLGPDGLPDPWVRPVIPVYARLLAGTAPVEAIAWAEKIDEAEEREIVLTDVARIWRNQDEAAAEAWLAQSSLSEESREKARKPKSPLPAPAG